MKKSDIYEIAVKILGLYLIVFLVGQLKEVISYSILIFNANNNPNVFGGYNQLPLFIVISFNFLFLVAFVYFLLFRTKKITKIICDKADYDEITQILISKQSIYEIVLKITGLLILILSLPDFLVKFKFYIQVIQNDLKSDNYDIVYLITSALKIIIGILALSYSKSIASKLSSQGKISS